METVQVVESIKKSLDVATELAEDCSTVKSANSKLRKLVKKISADLRDLRKITFTNEKAITEKKKACKAEAKANKG